MRVHTAALREYSTRAQGQAREMSTARLHSVSGVSVCLRVWRRLLIKLVEARCAPSPFIGPQCVSQ